MGLIIVAFELPVNRESRPVSIFYRTFNCGVELLLPSDSETHTGPEVDGHGRISDDFVVTAVERILDVHVCRHT